MSTSTYPARVSTMVAVKFDVLRPVLASATCTAAYTVVLGVTLPATARSKRTSTASATCRTYPVGSATQSVGFAWSAKLSPSHAHIPMFGLMALKKESLISTVTVHSAPTIVPSSDVIKSDREMDGTEGRTANSNPPRVTLKYASVSDAATPVVGSNGTLLR